MWHFLRNQVSLFSSATPWEWLHFNVYLAGLCVQAWWARQVHYRTLSSRALRALRKSERVFVFGSGYSLNEISAREWAEICRHDTIGFNAFVQQHWVPVGFHLVRGWGEGANIAYNWRKEIGELARLIKGNPLYSKTVFLMQDEHFGQASRVLLAEKMLPEGTQVGCYWTAAAGALPTRRIEEGLRHLSGTLSDAVNLAFCLGWREIVLVGVDLYDTRYFWLKPDETFCTDYRTGERHVAAVSDRGQRFDQPHSTACNGVVEEMRVWGDFMRSQGVVLSVYNPRSLLAEVLPVYERSGERGG
jgi:hypothetical protein